jgi:hypothetical protein
MESFLKNELNMSINTFSIKQINTELLKKNLYKNLDKKQKYVMERYKGPPHGIDKYGIKGYDDFTNYFINKELFVTLNIKEIKMYTTLFGMNDKYDLYRIHMNNFEEQLGKIVKTINTIRLKNMEKYVSAMDGIINCGITNNQNILYRVMLKPFSSNVIQNFTSWSLYPLLHFGSYSQEFHIYVAKLKKNIKSFYVEYNGEDKNLEEIKNFPFYEYEFLLPRDLEFKTKKTITKKVKPLYIGNKFGDFNEQTIHVHYIEIIKKNKSQKNIINESPRILF